MSKIQAVRAACFAAVLVLAPLAVSADRGIQESQACAQTGTCCYQTSSICVVGFQTFQNRYYKESGPCP